MERAVLGDVGLVALAEALRLVSLVRLGADKGLHLRARSSRMYTS